MCTRKQANIELNPDSNTLVRPSPFRRSIAWITLVAYIGQPMIVTAEVITAANSRTTVDVSANGLPLVQIATPNSAGLSHNQYTQFNVGPGGAILNNSTTAVQTQQAGFVSGNQNLANGSARIILNEVTGTSRSQLNGYTEVAGQQAEVIIANPNGITCNGCGFINTSRGVLTTGTPVIGSNGSLDAFRVTGGDINIGSAGLNAGNLSQLDLIARSVEVNGEIWANNLNVIAGTNEVNYNMQGMTVITNVPGKPAIGIDVKLLGGMYANKIYLVGTEEGVGVRSFGKLAAQAGDFTLNSAGLITLTGNTTASGNISISSSNTSIANKTNTGITNTGTLYSQHDVLLTSTGSIVNTKTDKDHLGVLSAGGNLTLNADSLNSTGTLGSGIDLYGNATQIGNLAIITQGQTTATGTNVAGSNMSITASSIKLAGSQSSAGSGIDLNATAGDINNSNATLITMLGLANLNTTGTLINSGGKIDSGQDISINASTLSGNGQIVAGRDTSINLQGNYTNTAGNVIKANRDLTFGTTGIFTNQSTLEAVGNLTVNAGGIDNQAGALINSVHTTLRTGTGNITNMGRIEGNIVDTFSNNFTNSATVIGNVVSINANNISNLDAAAMIAATQSVNLIVANALVNRNGANILSLGAVNIGSNNVIDPITGFLSGNAVSVTNQSATIEATNALRISAATITNERTVVGLINGPTWDGTPVVNTPVNGGLSVDSYTPTYAIQQFTAATTPAAQFLSGGNMYIGGSALNNNYSSIIARGTLATQMAPNNYGPEFLKSETRTGMSSVMTSTYHPQQGTCGFISNGCVHAYTSWARTDTPFVSVPQPSTTIPGLNYTKLDLSPTAYLAAKGNNTVVPNATTTAALNLSASAITLPTNGLYTIHSQPGQPYLVVTDPRFTSYGNYISSDYMLSRLALDSQLIEKRLGDGFYEQKLVTDQVTAATGRRYLGDYSDAQAQFIALLNSGVDAAEEFNLALGVALTATQINALKHDIVWMVERSVTLPNGTTERVLAPQVYLSSLQAADLKPSGALIAANVININTVTGQTTALDAGNSGMFSNSGTIRANTSLTINAKDIKNEGGTISSGGSVDMIAINDILNLSGKINGDTVNLSAGRDIRNETTSRVVTHTVSGSPQTESVFGFVTSRPASVAGVVKDTELGLTAGISATHTLTMNAARDISIVGATVNAGGDATLNATRDLTVGVLTATNTSTAERDSVNHTTVTQHTSSIQTGGNLSLVSGNDMHLTSVALDVGKDATLLSGGDLTLDASKNSASLRYNTGSAIGRFNDEDVLGSTLNAGGNISLAATQLNTDATKGMLASLGNDSRVLDRTDGKGNITLESTAITSKTGKLTVAADADVKIGVTEENHDAYTESHATGSGMFTHTTLDVRNESWSTDTIGSSLSGDSISIASGKDIKITGSTANAEHDINVVAMGDVTIYASTDTYGTDHYSRERTTGLQIQDGFNITDNGPETIRKASTDGTNQSQNRSSLISKNGNLSILAVGYLDTQGIDLSADKGELDLNVGGTVLLSAGQDTYNESSSTQVITNPNFFTRQRHTITDTYGTIDYQGSTLSGKSVKIKSGGDTILQVTSVTAGEDGINIDAGGDIKMRAAANIINRTHTESLSTDGYIFRADGSLNDTDTRRINNKHESLLATNQVTSLISGGNITTHSGGDTLIEASNLDAQGSIDLSATGYADGTNADGTKYKGRKGTVTFAAIKDSNYINNADSNNSMPWQNSSGNGQLVETIKLANIKAGKGMTVDAKGGIIVDIPEVPAEAPAPVVIVVEEPIPTEGPDGKPLTDAQKAAIVAERAAKAAEKAAQAAAAKLVRDEQRFNDHIQTLASKPGQEWIGQLAKQAKDKPDSVKLQQVNAALEHWDYSHGSLTPEAAAVIAIVIIYFSSGTASKTAGAIVNAANVTVAGSAAATIATAAIAAGLVTIAVQSNLALINNKGDIGKTFEDMNKSENIKAVVMAMITAGVLQGLSQNIDINGTSMASIDAKSSFPLQLQKNIINQATAAVLNHAMYGGDLQQQLEQSLRTAFIDTGAAQSANRIGDMLRDGDLNAFTHKLAHALAGCAIGVARSNDCSSGALGAVVGEMSAEWYGGSRTNSSGPDMAQFKSDTVNFAKMMAGFAAAITGGNAAAINLAANTGGNAAENNWLNHADAEQLKKLKQLQQAGQCGDDCVKSIAGLELLDKLNNRELLNACVNGSSEECKAQIDRDPAALKYEVDNFGTIVVGRIASRLGDHSQDALASLGKALEKTEIKPLVNAQGVITGWAVDLGGADPETLRYWLGAGVAVGTVFILPTSAIDLIPGAGKGLKFITRGTERFVVEEATGKVLGKVDDVTNSATGSPVDIAHAIGADYTRVGKPTGGHSLLNGDVQIVPGTESVPDAFGVYKATIQVPDPQNPGQWISKTSNGSMNTMFPKDWDALRIQSEVDAAWNSSNKIVNGSKWSSFTPSGMKVEGYISPRTTVYPVYQP